MADELKKNPNEESGEQQRQDIDQRQRDQQDPSKKQPTRPGEDVDQEQDHQQERGGHRRAS